MVAILISLPLKAAPQQQGAQMRVAFIMDHCYYKRVLIFAGLHKHCKMSLLARFQSEGMIQKELVNKMDI